MKKIIIGDFTEYNSPTAKLGNYHYCNCFVKDGYEALWMSNAFNQLIYFKDRADYRYKKAIASPQRHRLGQQVYGFAPYSWRLYGNYPGCKNAQIIAKFEKYIRPDITASLSSIGFLDVDVLWISNPKMYWLTNVVRYQKLIYRIADDYGQFSEFPNIKTIDAELIRKADKVVIASSTLEPHVRAQGRLPLLMSNGAEFEHFNQPGADCPPEYLATARRRLVYIGALKSWFDQTLIAKIAEQVEAEIFIIGKCDTDLSSLAKYANIHILGARHYDLLPGYLQHAQVALIPFIKSPATDGISPIKLYEYCSAGIAVVSTYLEETARQNAPIWLAETHEKFVAGIRYYLAHDYDRTELIDFGRNNSWTARYALIKQALIND